MSNFPLPLLSSPGKRRSAKAWLHRPVAQANGDVRHSAGVGPAEWYEHSLGVLDATLPQYHSSFRGLSELGLWYCRVPRGLCLS